MFRHDGSLVAGIQAELKAHHVVWLSILCFAGALSLFSPIIIM